MRTIYRFLYNNNIYKAHIYLYIFIFIFKAFYALNYLFQNYYKIYIKEDFFYLKFKLFAFEISIYKARAFFRAQYLLD